MNHCSLLIAQLNIYEMDELEYWLKGEREQNFGDYLSEYIAKRLFIRTPRDVSQVRIIGSFLEDWFVQQVQETTRIDHGDKKRSRLVAWGGGVRKEGGLTPQWQCEVETLSVRGPISASELRLGAEIPLGDPALLLPALYEAQSTALYENKTLCVPHFHDRRSDHELLAISAADLVLRPNIVASDEAVERFIDAIFASRFVLTASLHGAIVAAAYGKPFAFWDPSGSDVDLVIKWKDFAGSVGIDAKFLPTVQQGLEHYNAAIAPNLKLPSLWRALARAPYLLNTGAVFRILRHELAGADREAINKSFAEKVELFTRAYEHFSSLANESRELIARSNQRADYAEGLVNHYKVEATRLANESTAIRQEVSDRDARIRALDEKFDAAWRDINDRDARIRALDEKLDAARRELNDRDARIEATWREVGERDAKLHRMSEELGKAREYSARAWGEIDALRNSRSWRITAPYRAIGAVVKSPFQMVGASGILFRLVLGMLMLLPASVYSGGLRAAYTAWRRTPNFASEVFAGQHQIQEGLKRWPTWLRRSAMASFSAGYRLYTTQSVSRTIACAFRIVHANGWQGIGGALRATVPESVVLAHLDECDAAVSTEKRGNERRVLVVDYRIPRGDTSAGERATVGIIHDLVSMGFEVSFLPNDMLPSAEYEAKLTKPNVRVITIDSGFENPAQFINAHGSDFGLYYVFRYDIAENVLQHIRNAAPSARVIFHAPDLYFLREMREAKLLGEADAIARAESTRRREVAIMNQSDQVVLVSPAEIPYLREELERHKSISVFPVLYAPVEKVVPAFHERRDIFFLGGYGHTPNVSAVEWFVEHVWPLVREALPQASFHIVGAEVSERVIALERMRGVKVVGFVPDLKPIFSTYRVGVAPLLYGAGIKGKVASTLGAGIPCVCTDIAAEGMGIENEVHGLVESDACRFAAAVVRLYEDEALWTRLSVNGQDLVEARFGEVANRGALFRVLNEARALPLSLWQEYCERTASVAVPVHPADMQIDISIIVPAYNKWAMTRTCLASVVAASAGSGVRYELILADDASTDETRTAEQLVPGLRVIRTAGNVGFLRNCNNAAQHARGQHILLLNNDTVVLPGWLNALVETIDKDESIAIVGSKLLYPNGDIQEAGGGLFSNAEGDSIGRWFFDGRQWRAGLRYEPVFNFERESDYQTGASILIRGSFWRKRGGFDEGYGNAYCEDADLAMEARATGFRVVYQPKSEVVHLEHQSYSAEAASSYTELQLANKRKLLDKWKSVFERHHLPQGADWYRLAAHGERSIPPKVLARRAQSSTLNVLYFSPFPSHPGSHGNQATIQQFARQLQSMGHKVHFALLFSTLFDEKAKQSMRSAWDSLTVIPYTNPMVADGAPIPFDGWYEPGLGERIRSLCALHDIDVVLCSYIFQSKMLEYIPSYMLRIIDTHDKMGDRYDMLRERGLPLEFFSCPPEEEGAYLRRADIVFARRQEEADYFNSVSGRNSAVVVPHFEVPRFDGRSFVSLRKIAVVASANLINLVIVRDFLQAIDQRLDGAGSPVEVLVAGQVRDMVASLPSGERAVFGRPWVRMLGFVEDIDEFYGSVDLVVSPVTIGTGINVKTVQAMAYGMPLLTTGWGSKGIETEEPLHNLKNLEDLVNAILDLVAQPQLLDGLAASSRRAYQRFFDAGISAMRSALEHVPRSVPSDFELNAPKLAVDLYSTDRGPKQQYGRATTSVVPDPPIDV